MHMTFIGPGPASATAPGYLTTGAQSIAGAKTWSGNQRINAFLGVNKAPACHLDVEGNIRATGFTAPTAGTGVESGFSGGVGYIQSITRPGGTYDPLDIRGSTIYLRPSGTDTITLTASSIAFALPAGLKAYTVATLPSAATPGQVIYVSNGAAGSPVLAFSDGANWLRCDTLATVS